MREIPSKYDPAEAEARWRAFWDEAKLHAWDPTRSREDTFVVDTPPPTVSGSLHVGHVFSYTHQDLVVRYQRMCGRNISYPMGWDDNGLPTERRVQNVFGIRCEPRLPHDPDWKPRRDKKADEAPEDVSRRNFIEACAVLTAEDEAVFEAMWRRLALSIDWSNQYATIDPVARRISQLSFLDMVEKGEVYQTESPTMWDVDFQTAVAQAEVEDRERPGAMHVVRFATSEGGELKIMTTRPELLAACIAVVAHPDDQRYQHLFGKTAITPLFGAEVPILPAPHADPEKGTGILMVCTFGDGQDVEWWKQSELPLKQVIGRDGRMLPATFGASPFKSVDPARAQAAWKEIQGLWAKQARTRMAELLAEDGTGPDGKGAALEGEPEAISHPVKFYEKGDRPLELVSTRQWFVRILDKKHELLAQGEKIAWHPPYMRKRYDSWVEGLNQDWCISRQRYFGVPFPVWYRIDAEGRTDFSSPIHAPRSVLPVDPLTDVPTGYTADQRDVPGGFTGDPDVMDTWATSSLTPQIVSRWGLDPERHEKLFPMDVRPQSHEIIRTWAFYTIVKAYIHERTIPWHNVVISGWILDPDRKKMSKSKGNVVTPDHLLDEHSVDGVRYWAARARLGQDTAFDPKVFQIGKKLATKVFNASRFAFSQIDRAGASGGPASIHEPLDLAFVSELRATITRATRAFDAFDYAGALQAAEESFWSFCDHYLEIVKGRSYADDDTPGRRSAIATLELALSTYLRLLAPFLPYVTEEVWSWRLANPSDRTRSVHTAPWPTLTELSSIPPTDHPDAYELATLLMTEIRGAKTAAQKSLKWPVTKLEITASAEAIKALRPMLADLAEAGRFEVGVAVFVVGKAGCGGRIGTHVTLGDA